MYMSLLFLYLHVASFEKLSFKSRKQQKSVESKSPGAYLVFSSQRGEGTYLREALTKHIKRHQNIFNWSFQSINKNSNNNRRTKCFMFF